MRSASYGLLTSTRADSPRVRVQRRDRNRKSLGVVFREGFRNTDTSWTRWTVKRMAAAYKAAVRIGDKIPRLSAANAMSTACEDVGPKKRTSRSLFARRYAKARTQVNRNNDFRSGCQRATSM